MPDSTPEPRWWWARFRSLEEPGTEVLTAVVSDAFPAGSVVDQPDAGRPPGWMVSATVRSGCVRGLDLARSGLPLLWFVEVAEPAQPEPAATLIAFSDPRFPGGSVLDPEEAQHAGVDGDAQVGALRWWTATGVVHQLYVAPQHRRRGIGAALGVGAFALQAVRGGPDLHGNGRRTEMGEVWRERLHPAVRHYFAPWTERAAPMTPGT